MSATRSNNAFPKAGNIFVTIEFKIVEIKDKKFISEGQSHFVSNVSKQRNEILRNAIYNAVKKEFPNRTVTPYNIKILEYHYSYYLEDYKIEEKDNKTYETYIDTETNERKYYLKDRYSLKEKEINKLAWSKENE